MSTQVPTSAHQGALVPSHLIGYFYLRPILCATKTLQSSSNNKDDDNNNNTSKSSFHPTLAHIPAPVVNQQHHGTILSSPNPSLSLLWQEICYLQQCFCLHKGKGGHAGVSEADEPICLPT